MSNGWQVTSAHTLLHDRCCLMLSDVVAAYYNYVDRLDVGGACLQEKV